jgi:hypothetical protein
MTALLARYEPAEKLSVTMCDKSVVLVTYNPLIVNESCVLPEVFPTVLSLALVEVQSSPRIVVFVAVRLLGTVPLGQARE